MASNKDHQPMQPPTGTELSPATSFLLSWLSYFVESSDPDFAKHKSTPSDFSEFFDKHFAADAVVEFPYLPRDVRAHFPVQPLTTEQEGGGRLVGREEILRYFTDWRAMFWFSRGDIKTLAGFSGNEGVVEARMIGKLLNGDQPKDYIQDYVSFAKVDGTGKVLNYREHWAFDRFQ